MKKKEASQALNGVVIADFTQLAQGPWATQMLGDMGAEIIKVEPPGGDWMRHYAYGNLFPGGESISFLSFNRNKRSIVLDLKQEKHLQVAKDIIAKADILVENFRPGVMSRLGLGYDEIKNINPRLIFCSSSGYGVDGPYADRPGQDLLAQAVSGVPYFNGSKDQLPVVTAVGMADLLTSLFIVQSVLAALYQRNETGLGQKIDACLLNSILSFHTQEITSFLHNEEMPERSGKGIPNPWLGAPYGLYKTMTGYIAIGMNSVKKLAELVGLKKYAGDKYDSNNILDNRDEIKADFEKVFITRTTDEWLDILLPHDIWCAKLNSLHDMKDDKQVLHNEMILEYDHPKIGKIKTPGFPVKFSSSKQQIRRVPPTLGQHTEEILREFSGLSDEEIKTFK